jgi:hypothetical protein
LAKLISFDGDVLLAFLLVESHPKLLTFMLKPHEGGYADRRLACHRWKGTRLSKSVSDALLYGEPLPGGILWLND